MLLFIFTLLLVLLQNAHSQVSVSVDFENTVVPNEQKKRMVCEAVHSVYSQNVSKCLEVEPMQYTFELYLRTETVLLSELSPGDIEITQSIINQTNSYLLERDFFDFPETGRINLMFFPVDLKWVVYVSISIVMLVLTIFLLYATGISDKVYVEQIPQSGNDYDDKSIN